MQLAAALDVSISKSAICLVKRSDGSVVFETTVPTEPEEIAAVLAPFANRLHLVGTRQGCSRPGCIASCRSAACRWSCLRPGMRVPISCPAQQTDRNDALALAPLVRTRWFKAVHIKSEESLRLRLLMTQRRTLKRKILDIENEVRQSVRVFGIRLGSGFASAMRRLQSACAPRSPAMRSCSA